LKPPILRDFFEPGQATSHTIAATITTEDYCSQGGQWGIDGLSLDVIRMQ